VRRRQFIAGGLAGAAAWPLLARAQQQAMPVIGFLSNQEPTNRMYLVEAFREGLAKAGFIEGRTVRIEYRWAENQQERLEALADDLVQRQVSVVVATGGVGVAQAAKRVTTTIPIVFITGSDPVKNEIVSSLNGPVGNAAGITFFNDTLGAQRLALLRELAARGKMIAILINHRGPNAKQQLEDLPIAADSVAQPIHVLRASTELEIDAAFADLAHLGAHALLVGADPFFNARRHQIVALVARASLPAIYEIREFVVAGGLMSYGTSITDAYHQLGLQTAKILNGAKPVELPVVQSAKFELIINLKTAMALGIEISPMLLARADEVIE
jgi:putative ABC transport system substrate-binding protein